MGGPQKVIHFPCLFFFIINHPAIGVPSGKLSCNIAMENRHVYRVNHLWGRFIFHRWSISLSALLGYQRVENEFWMVETYIETLWIRGWCLPGWWFGTFFIFPYIGNKPPTSYICWPPFSTGDLPSPEAPKRSEFRPTRRPGGARWSSSRRS